jgi:hypothetical protein
MFAYQWLRDGTAVTGATSASYTLSAGDAGASVSVRVTGTMDGYRFRSVTSAAVAVPASPPPPPGTLTAGTAAVTGTPAVGSQLTATPGTWSPAGVVFSYQWLRDGAAISGATSAAYAPVAADVDASVAVRVTGSLSGYTSTTVTSAAVAVRPGALTAGTAAVGGTAQVGSVLTATPGTWSPAGVVFSYQWLRDGAAVTGATSSAYTLSAGDAGTSVSVRVTGSLAGYASRSVTSAPVAVPPSAPPPPGGGSGDWDGDGHVDLLSVEGGGDMWLYRGDGTGGFRPGRQLIGRGWAGYRLAGAGDRDGDGAADLLAVESGGRMWLYRGAGDGTFMSGRQLIGTGWGGYTLAGAGDRDGDGNADLLAVESGGRMWLYRGDGTGGFMSGRQLIGTGWGGYTLIAA